MLLTLEDFKQHNEIDTNDDDELIRLYCEGVSDFIKQKLNRSIEETDIEEVQDGDDINDTINLKDYPVIIDADNTLTLSYSTGDLGNKTWTEIEATTYEIGEETGQIFIDGVPSGRRNILIEFTAGYFEIPAAIRLAAIKLVSRVYNKKRSEGFSSEEVAGARIDWSKFYSDDIEELISPYRRVLL
jgi:hypothetical protein